MVKYKIKEKVIMVTGAGNQVLKDKKKEYTAANLGGEKRAEELVAKGFLDKVGAEKKTPAKKK